MAKMNSKFKYMYDAAPSVALEAKGGAARTATFDGEALELDQLNGYWNSNELADQTFAVAVNIDALDVAEGDETYALELEFGDDAAFTNSVKTHTVAVGGTGQVVFLVDIDTVRAMLDTAAFVRLAGTLGGTTPSITFHAFIAGAIIR